MGFAGGSVRVSGIHVAGHGVEADAVCEVLRQERDHPVHHLLHRETIESRPFNTESRPVSAESRPVTT